MVIVAILAGTGLVLELCAALTAPLGYQDEHGFHIGAESADEAGKMPRANPSR